MKNSRVLITGSTGFIGKSLIKHLLKNDFVVTAAVRKPSEAFSPQTKQINIGNILPDTDWSDAFVDIHTVIHLAARVHVMNDTHSDPWIEFNKVNTLGTLNLAEQAAKAGVKRLVYLSSIKVNGEFTLPNQPFTAEDVNIPTDPYGLSKYEAEQGLKKLSAKTGLEIVIIRPPLVYGPGVKANFKSMMSWLNKGVPLPLGLINNQRSLVAIDNLVDLICVCAKHPAAASQTFLVSDDDDLSTTQLLQRMASALGKPARLLPIPTLFLTLGASLTGKRDVAQRLCGSLQVDISHTKDTLGWKPPFSADEALQKTADAYLKQFNQKK